MPLHPKNLSQLIHPHWGYMSHMPEKSYSWKEMLDMYEIHMIASYEKAKGRYLHGEELAALSFWLTQDVQQEGFLDVSAMKKLCHGLRFTDVQNWKTFRDEFAFSIPDNELRTGNEVLRFDLIRQIFLDRGL